MTHPLSKAKAKAMVHTHKGGPADAKHLSEAERMSARQTAAQKLKAAWTGKPGAKGKKSAG
jgi:hypothetical protein